MVLREKDDADYYYNHYKNDPTQENLDLLVKYRPQDHYDEINKKGSLEDIRNEKKIANKKKSENKQMKITDLYDSKIQLGPIDMFVPNPWNTNEMTQEEFESLKESIRTTKGMYLRENPLKVRESGVPGKVEIVDGEHRWRACKELGIAKIPFEKIDIGTEKAQKLNVIYSMNRGNINYFKLSKLLNEYYDNHKITQEELAKEFGLGDKRRINNILKIYQRLNIFYEKVSAPRLFGNYHLEELANCRNDLFREKLIDKTIENKWNSKTIRTQATKFNQISDYIEDLTQNEGEQLSIIEKIEDVLFEFDFGPIKNKIDLLFREFSKQKIIQGDCFEKLPEIEQAFDCILTDPPYNLTEDGTVVKFKDRKEISTEFGEWDNFSREEFLKFLKKFLSITTPKIKDGGSILIFTSDRYISHLRDMLIEFGLNYRSTLYWHKTNPTNSVQKNRDVSSVEIIVYATKGDKRTYNWLGQNKAHNFIETSTCMGKERTTHPTQKPLEVVKWLLEKYTNPGDLVLDPFAGSGTIGIACKEMGRDFILIEKEQKFYDLIDMRLKTMEVD